MKIVFVIHGQPVSMKNRRQLVRVQGRPMLIKSPEARQYEKDFQKQLPAAARQMLHGPVRVTMRLVYASQRPDMDGALLLDLMAPQFEKRKGKLQKVGDGEFIQPVERVMVAKGCYCNDRQVRELHCYHGIDKANPRAEIEVETLEMQQAELGDLLREDEAETEANPF